MLNNTKSKILEIILKSLMSVFALIYLVIFISEITPPYSESIFGVILVFYLFSIFLTSFYFSWRNDFFASGMFTIIWYLLLLIFAFWIWRDAGTTIVLGFPVFIIGIFMFIFGLIKKKKFKIKKKNKK